jgi:hypothetical protein
VPILRTLLVLLAGTVPFGAIVAERRLTSLYDREERRAARADSRPDAPAAADGPPSAAAGTAPQDA